MRLSRRTAVGMLAGVAAGVAPPQAPAQSATPAAPSKLSGDLAAAREGLQDAARRIATVKLPHSTEPAFQFRV
jgi:hypothetical protein